MTTKQPPEDGRRARAVGDGLAALLDESRELLMILEPGGTVAWLSPAAERWLGPSVAGQTLPSLVHPDDAGAVTVALAALSAATSPGGRTRGLPCRLRDAAGAFHPMELALSDRRDHPTIAGLVCVAREVVEQSEVAAQLIHQATHDTLTALPNRSSLLGRLTEVTDGGDRPCALLYLDLDGFKAVNDSLGHAAGDRVLVSVAERLRRAVRPGDTVARLHGDEFVVVAVGVSDPGVAMDIAGRIVAGVGHPIALNGRLVHVSASVGVTLGSCSRAGALLEEADRAMFRAKERGRNQSALFAADMRNADDGRHAAEKLLRDALEHDGLVPLYQPVVHLGTGRLAGVEAMLRVRRPDGTLAAPSGFLDIAEETGLAAAVGSGLLDLACEQVAAWRRQFGPASPALLSVPTSVGQLSDARAADRVTSTLERHGLEASTLCLELAAESLADATSGTVRTLEVLKSHGVRLAVDGFGAGHSSVTYLRRLNVDLVRIDPSFLRRLGHDDAETEVLRAVISLAEALGMTTVATGVKTAAHARLLAQLGCHLGQGTYFGRPARADESPLQPA